MTDWFKRIKAALTPQMILLLFVAMVFIGYAALKKERSSIERIERQASEVLSQVEGAGHVEVTVMTRKTQMNGTGLLSSKSETGEEVPCGAMAVAQGADDPLVRMELEQALCALLGLPSSAVSVMAGGR